MKKLVLMFALVGLLAAPAMAGIVDRSNTPILTATPQQARAGAAVYSSLGPGIGGYIPGPTAVGSLGWDDYGTMSCVNLTAFKFVGGVTAPGAVMWFEFYDAPPATGNFLTSFGVLVNTPGAFIWTITFSSPPFVIPHDAYLQICANSTFTPYPTTIAGYWFETTPDAVTVGVNNTAVGTAAPNVKQFSMHIPEPVTLALVGMGALVLLRRRR